jgi:hypothetical protein
MYSVWLHRTAMGDAVHYAHHPRLNVKFSTTVLSFGCHLLARNNALRYKSACYAMQVAFGPSDSGSWWLDRKVAAAT